MDEAELSSAVTAAAGEVDPAEDNDMIDVAYIDRLVDEVNGNADEEDDDYDEAVNELGISDDDFEYDSDDDSSCDVSLWPQNSARPRFSPPFSEERKAQLLWRLEKEESFSDWSIEVTDAGDGTTKTYHVHRCILAAGTQKSGYFEAIFKSNNFKESEYSKSQVNLSQDAAARFPDFLDFIYSPPLEIWYVVTGENWRGLHFLAKYFIVPKLTEAIHAFIGEYMCVRNLEECLLECCGIDDDDSKSLLEFVTKACSRMILHIGAGSSLLHALPPAMFLQIISIIGSSKRTKQPDYDSSNKHICSLAVDYIQTYHSSLDARYFIALVGELNFPREEELNGSTALALLELVKLAGWECDIVIKDSTAMTACVALLSQSLAEERDDPEKLREFSDLVSDIAGKIPLWAVGSLLSEGLHAKKAITPKKIVVDCRVNSDSLGVKIGSVFKVTLRATDSTDKIRLDLSHHLDVGSKRFHIYKDGHELVGNQNITALGITSRTELEVGGCVP